MKKLIKNNIGFLTILLFPIVNVFYPLLNNDHRPVHSLETPIDHIIPFIPIFVIPYLYWYVFIIFGLWIVYRKRKRDYAVTLLTMLFGNVMCYITYFFFQTTVSRPELHGNGLLTSLMHFVYGKDQPFNCFPSIHVFITTVMVISYRRSANQTLPMSILFGTSWVLIILSTFFIKQHVVLDAIAGFLLAETLYPLMKKVVEKIKPIKVLESARKSA